MPAMRPEAISNRVRLAYEVRAAVRALVSEYGAVNSVLPAVVDKSAPDEAGVSGCSAEHNLFAWAAEQLARSPVRVSVRRVVPLIEFEAVKVSILRQPPVRARSNHRIKPTCLRHAAYAARYACGPSGLTFLVFSGHRHI